MTAPTNQLDGAMMKDEQIIDLWNRAMGSVFTLESRALAFARALLSASKPAAIDKQEAVCWIDAETLRGFSNPQNGWRDRAVSIRRGEAVFESDVPLYAAPLDKEASKPAASHGWKALPPKLTPEMKAAMVKAACEYMERTGGNSPDAMYEAAFAAHPAAPSVAQDERGACMCSGLGPCERPGDTSCRIARAASTSANVAQGAEAVPVSAIEAVADFLEDQANIGIISQFTAVQEWIDAHAIRPRLKFSAWAATHADWADKYDADVMQIGWNAALSYAAPPAQTALTDDARDAIANAVDLLQKLADRQDAAGFPLTAGSTRHVAKELVAAQSASGVDHE